MTNDMKETMKRANKYYQNPTDNNHGNLIVIYIALEEDEQAAVDVEIKKLLPSWAS